MHTMYYIDLLGTMVFAISGAMAASRQNIDVFGAMFTGFVTAIGGGSLRDIFLNLRPVWVDDRNYLLAILAGFALSVILNKQLYRLARTMFLFDTIGVGFFCIVGVQKSINHDASSIAAIILGIFSAVMGGVIRDTLMNETPLIFRREIYATACLTGSTTYVLLQMAGLDTMTNAAISVSLTVIFRVLAVRFQLSLPVIKSN